MINPIMGWFKLARCDKTIDDDCKLSENYMADQVPLENLKHIWSGIIVTYPWI